MKEKITKKQLLEKFAYLTKLAMFLNAETKADIFFWFSGHVDMWQIRIYYNGWKADEPIDYSKDIYSYNDFNIDRENTFDGGEIKLDYERSVDIIMKYLLEFEEKLIEIAKQNNIDLTEME